MSGGGQPTSFNPSLYRQGGTGGMFPQGQRPFGSPPPMGNNNPGQMMPPPMRQGPTAGI